MLLVVNFVCVAQIFIEETDELLLNKTDFIAVF
jgi:hypothetical protein